MSPPNCVPATGCLESDPVPASSVLPDTSVWVEYLRLGDRGRAADLGGLLDERRVLACGPVVAEVLAGTRPPDQEPLGSLLAGLVWAELDHAAWRRVGQVAGGLRRAGRGFPSPTS